MKYETAFYIEEEQRIKTLERETEREKKKHNLNADPCTKSFRGEMRGGGV